MCLQCWRQNPGPVHAGQVLTTKPPLPTAQNPLVDAPTKAQPASGGKHWALQYVGSVGVPTGRAWLQTPQGRWLWTGSSVYVAFFQKPQCPFLFHESVPLKLLQWFSCLVPQGGGSKAPVPTGDVPSGHLPGQLPASPLDTSHATQPDICAWPASSSSLFIRQHLAMSPGLASDLEAQAVCLPQVHTTMTQVQPW